jgi:hypothetical protein
MFAAVAADATAVLTRPQRRPPVQNPSLDVPPEFEARPTPSAFGLHRFCERSGIMRRLVVVLLLTLLALVATTPSALAAKPTHERLPIDQVFVTEACGFPVEINQSGFVVVIEWVNENGTLRRFEAYPSSRPL